MFLQLSLTVWCWYVIVSAVLEHEAIAGLSAGKPTGLRGRAHRGSVSEDRNKDMSLDMLMKAVCNWCYVFSLYLPAVKLLCYCSARFISIVAELTICKAGLLLNTDQDKNNFMWKQHDRKEDFRRNWRRKCQKIYILYLDCKEEISLQIAKATTRPRWHWKSNEKGISE